MFSKPRRHALRGCKQITLAFSAVLAAMPAAGQWPDRPIRMVVQFAAGGSTDIVGRTIGQAIASALAQPVVVENRPGAGGNIATTT